MRNLNQVRSVVALADHRNFGRAADAIGLTQSALSQNIRKVEDIYGVPLFERRNRQVALTSFGEVVCETARQTLDALRNVEREISLLKNLESGHLKVYADSYLANSLLAPALASLLNDFPHLRFTARQGSWPDVEGRLLNDEIDLYFGMPPDATHADIEYLDVELPSPLILCRAGHELESQERLNLAELIRYPIVTPAPPAWYVRWAQAQVASLASPVDVADLIILESDSIAMVKTVALQSNALTAALAGDVREEIRSGAFRVLKLVNWPNTMSGCLAMRRSRALPPAAGQLIERINQTLQNAFTEAQEFPLSG